MINTCGIFLYSKKNQKFLMVKATNGWNFSIPKGQSEDGEDFIITAVREMKEEVGIDVKELQNYTLTFLGASEYDHGKKTLQAFFCSFDDDNFPEVNLQLEEVDKYWWVTLDELMKKVHKTQKKFHKYLLEEIELCSMYWR